MQENSPPKPSHPHQQATSTTTTTNTIKQLPAATNRKPPSSTGLRPPEQSPNCPRCDSPNTKFCYYNNYSLTQPRHFCKTCRRYWTEGGALRNGPIGGGCRKNKRSKRNSDDSKPESAGKYFPAMDFGLPRLQSPQFGLLNHLISSSSSSSSSLPVIIDSSPPVSLFGFNYLMKNGDSNSGFQCLGSQSSHSTLASSIESLSTINADLHWKLQQQRLAMVFDGGNQKETGVSVNTQQSNLVHSGLIDYQEQEPILFQNLGGFKNDGFDSNPRKSSVHDHGLIRGSATEWSFENSYTNTNTTITTNNNNNSNSNWNGFQAWTDLQQYSALN